MQTLSGLRGAMFLLNSQVPLVTATCGPRGDPRTAGTPSCERTGPICRVPLRGREGRLVRIIKPALPSWPGLAPRRLGLFTQGHLCRFSVRARGILPSPLFMGPGGRRNPHTRAIPPFSPFSPLRHSRALGWLARSPPHGGPWSAYPEALEAGLCVTAKRTPAAQEY